MRRPTVIISITTALVLFIPSFLFRNFKVNTYLVKWYGTLRAERFSYVFHDLYWGNVIFTGAGLILIIISLILFYNYKYKRSAILGIVGTSLFLFCFFFTISRYQIIVDTWNYPSYDYINFGQTPMSSTGIGFYTACTMFILLILTYSIMMINEKIH